MNELPTGIDLFLSFFVAVACGGIPAYLAYQFICSRNQEEKNFQVQGGQDSRWQTTSGGQLLALVVAILIFFPIFYGMFKFLFVG